MMGKPKIGKAELEKVRNGVDLLPLLQERDLYGINKLSFIKTLLKQMKRDDLLKEVCNYEKESAKAAGAKPTPPTKPPRPKLGNQIWLVQLEHNKIHLKTEQNKLH